MSFWKSTVFVRREFETVEHLTDGWQRTKEIKEFVISTIEAVILLGAILAAINVAESPVLLIIVFALGWITLALYLMNGMKLFFAVLIDERGPSHQNHPKLRWFLEYVVFSILNALVSLSLPYVLPAMISEVIVNNLVN